jgi:outer membrane protein TolC
MRLTVLVYLLFSFLPLPGQTGPETISLAGAVERACKFSLPPAAADSLEMQVKSTYLTLVYKLQRYALLRDQESMLHDLDHVAVTRFREGDIDLLEMTEMKSRLARVQTDISIQGDEITISGNILKKLLQADGDLIPADSLLSLYMIRKNDRTLLPPDETMRENLELSLTVLFKKLRYFEQDGLELATQLLKINRLRYEKEDIGYADYTLAVERATNIRLEYLDTLNRYNQTAIQLEYYAY